jgi:hypothetical protein
LPTMESSISYTHRIKAGKDDDVSSVHHQTSN